MSKRPKRETSARAARRASDRDTEKARRDLERLDAASVGASPARPSILSSASQVEVDAVSRPCPICGGALLLTSHDAETIDGVRLRVARVVCKVCRAARARYYRLVESTLH